MSVMGGGKVSFGGGGVKGDVGYCAPVAYGVIFRSSIYVVFNAALNISGVFVLALYFATEMS